MQKRVVLNSPRLSALRRKKHKSSRRRVTILMILFLIFFLVLSFMSRINKININQINVSGNKIIETKDIKNVIQDKISGHYIWLFPKTNFLLYPKYQITNELHNKFKRLKDISINVENFRTLAISVSEYEGKYLWCGEFIPVLDNTIDNNKCYFLDESGYIFDEAPYFSGNVYFKFYGDTILNKVNPSGTYFLKDKFSKIIKFKDNIEKMNLKPTVFWLDSNRKEGNFSIGGDPGTGPKIIFKMDGDFDVMAENLQAAISTEPLRTDLRTKLSSLLYLDLRFGNKVYYKFK